MVFLSVWTSRKVTVALMPHLPQKADDQRLGDEVSERLEEHVAEIER